MTRDGEDWAMGGGEVKWRCVGAGRGVVGEGLGSCDWSARIVGGRGVISQIYRGRLCLILIDVL